MPERIYVVDPISNQMQCVESVSFWRLSVREREGLQEWVLQNPEVLGEMLLVITSEFDKFDKSDRRLDVLALDRSSRLVVVELKLDANGSLADLQAIRYAAFCSTMQMADVLAEMSAHEDLTEEEAESRILDFLEMDELPALGDEPRIILAAGSIDDQELTSCVLWLRRFGIDITCVELTPYKLPDADQIMLVPRVIIPLPEARDYIVSVERKEAGQRREQASRHADETLWRAIAQSFNALGLPFQARSTKANGYSQICFGDSHVHYEWLLRKRQKTLSVALHFEHGDPHENYRLLSFVSAASDAIGQGLPWEFRAEPWGKKWACAEFLMPCEVTCSPDEIAPAAAETMRALIERTWPLIRDQVKARDGFNESFEGKC